MDRTDNTELTNHTQPEDVEESRHQTEEAAASTLEPATEAEAPEEFLAEAQAEAPEEAPTEAQEEVPAEARVEALEEARGEVLAEALEEAPAEVLAEAPEEAVPEMSDMETMSELYEESLRRVQEGEVVKGRIVSITKEFVMVDIGYKSEGQIPIHEFTNVEGTVVAKVKGGLSVDLGGIIGFLPGSQVDLNPMRHTDHLIGQRYTFKVLKFNRKRRNVVLSRRHLLEKAKTEAKATLLATLEEDKVLEGVVKNITDYGIFVDLGGLDGLLHITDLSYGRVRHPADLYKVGDPLNVKVLSFDREKERISLGLKQLTPDPWTTVGETFPLGSRVTGRAGSLTAYGSSA